MTLAIDFDGVIHNHKVKVEGRKMGPPVNLAVDVLKSLKKEGHTLIIFTTRGDRPDHVREWLNWYKIPFDSITRVKPEADFYIDDKGIRFVDWNQTIQEMAKICSSG